MFEEKMEKLDTLIRDTPLTGIVTEELITAWEEFRTSLLNMIETIESRPEKAIMLTVEYLKASRLLEAETAFAEGEKRADLSMVEGMISARKSSVIAKAYAEDRVAGKNAEQRKGSEYQLLQKDEQLLDYEKDAYMIRQVIVGHAWDAELAKLNRQYYQDLLSARRIVLNYLSASESI